MRSNAYDRSAYRYIALDLDGTVLDAEYRVSPAVIAALARARAAGMKIIISTGRVYAAALPHARKIGGADGFVCCNGADIYDGNAVLLAAHHLGEAESRALVHLSRGFDSHFHGFMGDSWHFENRTPYTVRYETRTGLKGIESDFDSFPRLEFTKCIFMDEREKLLAIESAIAAAMGDSVRSMLSSPFMLEVVAPGISKSRGLAECLAGMGGTLAETISFGDAENDEDMLLATGLGVAMGNAPDYLREKVGRTTLSVDEDGVAVWLTDFLGS